VAHAPLAALPVGSANLRLNLLINRQPNADPAQRPLLGIKWTWRGLVSMSANDPKRTQSGHRRLIDRNCYA
jgi:hypothetical protein